MKIQLVFKSSSTMQRILCDTLKKFTIFNVLLIGFLVFNADVSFAEGRCEAKSLWAEVPTPLGEYKALFGGSRTYGEYCESINSFDQSVRKGTCGRILFGVLGCQWNDESAKTIEKGKKSPVGEKIKFKHGSGPAETNVGVS